MDSILYKNKYDRPRPNSSDVIWHCRRRPTITTWTIATDADYDNNDDDSNDADDDADQRHGTFGKVWREREREIEREKERKCKKKRLREREC